MKSKAQKLFLKAAVAHKKGDCSRAQRLYEAVLRSQPRHPEANYNYGLIVSSEQCFEQALPYLATAVSMEPKRHQYWESYVKALAETHQFEAVNSAIESARNEAIACESLLRLYNLQVDGLEKVSRFQEAETSCLSAIAVSPGVSSSYTRLAGLIRAQGRLEEAVEAYSIALQVDETDVAAHIDLGVTMKDLGRLTEAEKCYRSALDLQEDNFVANNNLGTLLKAMGRLMEAVRFYKRAVAINPKSSILHYNLGNCLASINEHEAAMKSFDQALLLDPKLDTAVAGIGKLLLRKGKHLQGLSKLRRSEGGIIFSEDRFRIC